MDRNLTLAAAVAAVLSAGSASASQPSPAAAASPAVGLYIAGSSAAKGAVLGDIETNLCGGSYSLFTSTGDTNFFAVSCTPSSTTGVGGANGTNVFTIWYRDEGGSVTGALPLVSGKSINQLVLTATTSTSSPYAVAVGGSTAANGIDDTFSGGVSSQPVQLGITDVEPGALIVNNYPSAYKTSAYGHATATQLAGLSATTIFDQVFGIFVNTETPALGGTATTPAASLNLTKEGITNILTGYSTDWSKVSDPNGNRVGSSSLPITIVNREQGSGSRTAADIYFTADSCTPGQNPIQESTGGTADYFSTGNVLAAANTIPGAITYASIDNAGSYANLTLVAIDGVTPSNLAAAAGAYDFWFEATAVTGSNYSTLTKNQQSLISYLTNEFQTEATAPGAVDVLAIPAYGNNATIPITNSASVNSGKTIYVNPFTRGGISCNDPTTTIF